MSALPVVAARGEAPALVVVQTVLDGCTSDHTRRAYGRALRDFLTWCLASGRRDMDRATVQRHVAALRERGIGAASINQRLAAIRRFAAEAADAGLISHEAARGIAGVRGVRQAGTRKGNWLSVEEAGRLLRVPDPTTARGARDRAILAVLLGCGLRRHEAAQLRWEYVQLREGHWVIVDLRGKGRKLRSVPMPTWTRQALAEWQALAGQGNGTVFRVVHRSGMVGAAGIGEETIRNVVGAAAAAAGLGALAPHDLRRTFAKLARRGGTEWEQLQMALGHASLVTTQRYVGQEQDLADAPGDRLGLGL